MIGEYLKYLKDRNISANTIKQRQSSLLLYESYINSNYHKEIEEATAEEIEDYIRYLKERVKSITIGNRLSAIRNYYRYLKKEDRILISPMEEVEYRVILQESIKDVLSEREIERLIESIPEVSRNGLRDKAMIELVYSSGLRFGEVQRLKITDIDLRDREVIIRKTKTKEERIVPVGIRAVIMIDKYLSNERKSNERIAKDNYLFISETGEQLKNSTLDGIIKRRRTRANIEKPLTWHTLRHSCALHMLRGGARVSEVQRMLGHKNIKTTEVYTKLNIEDIKEAQRRSHPSERERQK